MEVLKMKFGMNENNIDAHGIRLYGSIDNKTKQFTGISELIPDPDVLPMIQHKRVTLWFTFENIRPYTAVMDLINELEIGLKQRAYTIIASSLNDLVDTTSGEYKGRPESNFPVPYKTRGYNAARGFSITAEKVDEEMKFSIIEIEKIKEFAVKFGYIVYGRYLSNTEMAALDTEQSP